MTKPAADRTPLFSAQIVGLMVSVGLFGFMAVIVLSAWSPELQDRNRPGLHPYSTSATGYAGLVRLLEARGDTVSVSRVREPLSQYTTALKIVTLAPGAMEQELDELNLVGLALVVLPKREGVSDPTQPTWQSEVWLTRTGEVEGLLAPFDDEAEIWRVRAPARIETDFGIYRPGFEDDLQLIRSDRLEPVVTTAAGMVLAKVPDEDVYVLADPDFMNTVGLSRFERARFTTALIDWLRYDDRSTPVILDSTLHGFGQARSVLQMMFDVPFIGATLVALALFVMVGWTGAIRFGAPEPSGRSIALGKQALADSTAGLITLTRREAKLAPQYLMLTKRAAAKAIGAPRTLNDDQLSDFLDRVGSDQDQPFSDLAQAAANPATSREDLLKTTRRLYRWRQEITHGD